MRRRDYLGLLTGLFFTGCIGGTQKGNQQSSQGLETPTIGNQNSENVVEVYEDYMCPHCRTFNMEIYPKIKENLIDNGDIRYEFHDFPIPVHKKLSWKTAIAARSVQANKGTNAFFKYKNKIFKNQNSVSTQNLIKWATEININKETITQNLQNNTYKNIIENDKQQGIKKGVKGTPSIFVNNQKINSITYKRISELVSD